MLKYFVLFFGILSFKAFADIGFSHGGDLSAISAKGTVFVHCMMDGSNGPFSNSYYCRRDIITTGDYDYFVGPTGIFADKVVLTAHHQDGSETIKKVDYDSQKNRSKETVNLWIKTVFQRPLLDFGLNQVEFKMLKKKEVVYSGQFQVQVRDSGEHVCPNDGNYWSNNSEDCRNGQFMCNRFFNENNFCMK